MTSSLLESTTGAGSESRVDQTVFRTTIGHFASGVAVITTLAGGRRFGTTASAVSSVSLEPPTLLVCLNRTSETGQAVLASGVFAVNVLSAGQQDLAKRFASKGADKFGDVDVHDSSRGLPYLNQAVAHLQCRVTGTAGAGTHTIFIAEVDDAVTAPLAPLAYFRGRFGRFLEDES